MTGPGYQWKSTNQQETPAEIVTIGNVDIAHKNCAAIPLNGGGNIVVNLSIYDGPILVWPQEGEQWIVKRVKGQWILAERTYVSAQAYLVDAVPGDQVWDVQGNIDIDVTKNLNISSQSNIVFGVAGQFSVTDANGTLTTTPTPVWTPVTYQNGWSDLGGGFPHVEYIVDRNVVHFRGAMQIGTTITDGTPVFTVPSQYGIPAGQQGWNLASQAGTQATTGSGLKIVANGGGAFWIYSVGTVTAMFVDAISYFYKY